MLSVDVPVVEVAVDLVPVVLLRALPPPSAPAAAPTGPRMPASSGFTSSMTSRISFGLDLVEVVLPFFFSTISPELFSRLNTSSLLL